MAKLWRVMQRGIEGNRADHSGADALGGAIAM
jgi:hypothetical protein